jgi:cell division inhibitor SepF
MGVWQNIKHIWVDDIDEDVVENEVQASEPPKTVRQEENERKRTVIPARDWQAEPRENTREREKVTVMPGVSNSSLNAFTTKGFKIVVIEPKSFDECPKLVDSIKARKPVIINLEAVPTEIARKIFDFLSGGAYALNGKVQKIAQNIFVFLPENIDVSGDSEQAIKFGEEAHNPWKI